MLHEFKYAAPRGYAELADALANDPGAKVLAGGTDLLVNIRSGLAKPTLVVDIKRIPGADVIGWDPVKGLSIGPAVTVNALLRSREARERYPLLAAAGHELASHQVRNRATVAGNVANASPCADMAPALLCLDASAVLRSSAGSRTVPFSAFFTGVKKTTLAPGEFIEAITVPASSSGARGDYRKMKRVKGHDLGIVGVMVAISGGRLRIAVSSAAPVPVLVDGLPSDADPDEAVARTLAAVKPIDDVRCTAEYRLFMIETYVRRLLGEART